jgi:hypothetical protein
VRTTIKLDDGVVPVDAEPYRVPVFRGSAPVPGVDLNSNAALAEILDAGG